MLFIVLQFEIYVEPDICRQVKVQRLRYKARHQHARWKTRKQRCLPTFNTENVHIVMVIIPCGVLDLLLMFRW